MLDAAKARLQDALKEEEVARNEIAGLDAQGPSSLIAKISGKATKFAARYDDAKRRRVDAMKDLRFAQSHFDRSTVAFEALKKQWDAKQREIQRHRDHGIARIDFELQRIAQIRAILEQNPELALQPKNLAAAVTRSCELQAVDIKTEAPGYSSRLPL